MKHNAKRVLGLVLTLLMCVSMLTCIVLPAAAADAEEIPAVWGTYGLAPVDGETYVNLTTQSRYAARDGGNEYGLVFVAPDLTAIAHKTYEGALNGSADDMFTSSTHAQFDTAGGPIEPTDTDNELAYGDIFYAKMPTTGYVYKLAFGITAGDVQYTNTGAMGTVVFFPGAYDKGSAYGVLSGADYSVDGERTFAFESREGAFGVAHPSSVVLAYKCAEFRILGPQAGVVATNTADGTLSTDRSTDTTKEAVISGNYFYIMNGVFSHEGGNVTFDGLTMTGATAFYAHYSNAKGIGTYNYTTAVNIDNCNIYDVAESSLFRFYSYNLATEKNGTIISSSVALNLVKNDLSLNINGSRIKTKEGAYALSGANTDGLHIKNSVIDHSASSSDVAFRINAVTAANNANSHGISYTCENSWIKLNNSAPLFTFEGNATVGLSSSNRTGIAFEFKNNTVTDATALFVINANETAAENTNMAAITDITVTGNTVSGAGDLLTAYGSDYKLRSTNISGNTFKGYGAQDDPAFTDLYTQADVTENLYLNDDGKAMAVSHSGGTAKANDALLTADGKVRVSDFMPTGTAALKGGNFTYDKGVDLLAEIADNTAEVTWAEGITAEDIIGTLSFSSNKVSVVDLVTDDDVIDDETVFVLTLAHSDWNGTLAYKLTFACIHKSITPDTADGCYLAPTCGTAGYQKGTCNNCTKYVTKIIDPTGAHSWDVGEQIEEATCTKEGQIKYTCTNENCSKNGSKAVQYVTVEMLPHTPAGEVIPYEGKHATCYSAGEGYIDCTVCSQMLEEHIVIEQLDDHVMAQTVTVESAATCSASGTGYYACIYCHTPVIDDVTIPANGVHTGGEWVVTEKATLVKDGVETRYCIYCDEVAETRAIPALPAEDATKTFGDIKADDWYVVNGAVSYVYNAGLFKGTTATEFSPKASMTRGMFVTVLGRLHGLTSTDGNTKFTDVKSNKYYAPFVKWASENGIVNGVSATSFAPDSNITREQICVMLLRYCNYAKITLEDISSAYAFVDQDSISGYAKDAVTACQIAGIINGEATNNGYRFRPQGTATRAEVATILKNFAYNHL